ncbi:ribonuclease HIII [Mycoplasmopsis glycophila]|uniref:Ribonuclease n=1 Tax=Mycoplasmopsis glycophila TaxID=171285 RepID=A0A449AU80_9BACT|nr:ribonuclease HIII [Mycoplasmopsis glycophila]VEU70042.1 ribonuclease HII [Mycoplasmopsis glycophila]
MKIFDSLLLFDLNKEEVIGVDETGVGDYFTPLISCAAYVPNDLINWCIEIGVKDSKKLSKNQIMKIAPLLMDKIKYSIYRLTQEGYNKLLNFYNSNEMKFFSHINVLNSLLTKTNNPSLIVVDKYSTTNSINKYYSKIVQNQNVFKIKDLDMNVLFLEKAEEIHVSVACASIIARYALYLAMDSQEKEWNFTFPLGASSQVKQKVKEFSQIYGQDNLKKVCKLNFKID